MNALVWTANVLGFPFIHLVVGSTMLHLPAELFAQDSWLTREYRWERGGKLYRSVFGIHCWKTLLPDGAPWLGGVAKKRITSRSPQYLQSFVVETRRSELAHWCMLLCTPVFFLWNPQWACFVMASYGVAANLACILAQRANRIQLQRLLIRDRKYKRAGPAKPA
jgi:glycosyl-4,4'-diaponeurosporenoate acyltransferase